jgi:CRP-like cAMP-binding protein
LNLLTKRSIEPIKTSEGNLSARGLHHRSREQFEKDVKSFSHIITNSLRGRKMVSSAQAGTSSAMADFQLLPIFVQRALAYERLNEIDKAITDYNTAISIDPQFAPAYFNRSGLYGSRGDIAAAFRDINKAVELDPSNMTYRRNRTILFRQRGDYTEAIRETMLCRAVQLQPSIAKELKMGNHVLMDSDQLLQNFKGSQLNDPILEVLALPVEQRRIEALSPVVDFLAQVKIFKNYTVDRHFLNNIAINLEMKVVDKDVCIYRHLERSRKFYIVYDGEVGVHSNDLSPSKFSFATKRMGGASTSAANSRVCSPRNLEHSGGYDFSSGSIGGANRDVSAITNIVSKGGFFGEAALESSGILRPGDSKCLQPSTLFVISGEQFQSIFAKHKLTLQREVRIVLGDCVVFTGWDPKDLDSISATVSVQRFSPGSDILKAGDPVTKLLIIRSGVVKFVRTMNRPEIVVARAVSPPTSLTGFATYRRSSMPTQMPYSEAEEKEGAKPPGIWVREKNWKELLQMFTHEKNTQGNEWHATAGVLGSGQVFGELAVLQADATNGGARSPTSAIAYTEVELFSIDGAVLVAAGARFKAATMNALNDSFNLFNPPAEKVAYYMKAKFEWEKKRSKIVAAVMKDRKMKK